MKTRAHILLLLSSVFLVMCSPKTGLELTSATEKPTASVDPNPPVVVGPCATFNDVPNKQQVMENYVLYRDFLKAGEWDRSYELWKKVAEAAPAADGKRNTVLTDGIRFYEHFGSQVTSASAKKAYVDSIFALYDQLDQCYPEGGYIPARKAFDLYYEYPDRASRQEIYALFKEALDKGDLETPDFALNPFSALLVEMYRENTIDVGEAQEYQQKVRTILANGLENCEGTNCERWKTIEGYAPRRLEFFETVKGFYDCTYYADKYFQEFLDNPEDCDVIQTVFSRLRWGGCLEDDPRFQELLAAANASCRSNEKGTIGLAYACLRNADYTCAVDKFKEAISETDDNQRKGEFLLIIAKIYNAHLKNFSQARAYALQAAELRPDWGEPYILIGRLYASSGPLCGPGRGWDSQIVVWPAIDMWQKAKQVDPSVAAEANKWIRQYTQYMPKREDVFIRNLKVGDRFSVGCWIQRSTVIRTAN